MKIIKLSEYVKLIGISRQGLYKILKREEFVEGTDFIKISGTPMIVLNEKTINYKAKKPGKANN